MRGWGPCGPGSIPGSPTSMILILSTFPNKKKAHETGTKLLENKLIACYTLSSVQSGYWWKGKIERANEVLMIIKTNKKFDEIEKFIMDNHDYDTPEIISIEPKNVNNKYLKWLKDITG